MIKRLYFLQFDIRYFLANRLVLMALYIIPNDFGSKTRLRAYLGDYSRSEARQLKELIS